MNQKERVIEYIRKNGFISNEEADTIYVQQLQSVVYLIRKERGQAYIKSTVYKNKKMKTRHTKYTLGVDL